MPMHNRQKPAKINHFNQGKEKQRGFSLNQDSVITLFFHALIPTSFLPLTSVLFMSLEFGDSLIYSDFWRRGLQLQQQPQSQ